MGAIRTCLLLLALWQLPLPAEIVDRVVAVVGNRMISWSDLLAEADYQAFLAGHPPMEPMESARKESLRQESLRQESLGQESLRQESLRQVLSRLIDQVLLEQSHDTFPFSPPENGETQGRLEEIRKRFPDPEAYRKALAQHKLTEAVLVRRLEREANLMAFVEYRLRPQVSLDPAQVERYYDETLVPELRRQGQAEAPALSEVRESIEEILVQQEISRRLEEWLRELRERVAVKILL